MALLLAAAEAVAPPAELPQDAPAAEREALYRRQLLAEPEAPEAYLGLALALSDGGDRDEGVELLSQAGDRWLRRGDYQKAETVLAAAVDLEPAAASLLARLGRAQTLNRNHQGAVASLERAVELGNRTPETLAYLGTALWEVGRLEQAEARLRQSLDLERTALATHQLGRLLLWRGRYTEALPLLREVAGVSPSADALVDLAEAQRGAGEVEAAIATYHRVLTRAPEMIKAHYGLAAVLRQSGDLEGAQKELETVGRLHTASEERTRLAQRQKGEVDQARDLLRTGRLEEAIALLESLTESVDALSLMAQAHLRRGDATSAAAALERAVALDPANSELRRQLAEARRLAAGGGS
jgi:tetratricopeptide (TPR) repeat protein